MTRLVTYSLTMSLDGYIVDADGSFNWSVPDEEVFNLATDEVSRLGVHLLGRRLYETMRYWESVDEDPELDFSTSDFARRWNALPKVVFSSTLTEVDPSARLATGSLADEIALLKAEPTDSDIGIGGATLAAAAADLDLIDEYRIRILPVLVGDGIPYFAHRGQRSDLELIESRTVGPRTVYLRYRVQR